MMDIATAFPDASLRTKVEVARLDQFTMRTESLPA